MNTLIIILLFLILLLTIIYIIYRVFVTNKIIISGFTDSENTIDIVISRYNENLEWMKSLDLKYFRNIFIYNKGPELPSGFTYSNKIKIIQLDNVGRESHTYLYHIIQNYNKLADVTIFLPGSCDMEHKKDRAAATIEKSITTHNSVFIVSGINDVFTQQYDFTLTDYQSTNEENKNKNSEYKLYPCPEKPFGKWFEHNFGNIEVYCMFNCIFSASKKHIHNRSLNFYKNLIKYLDFHSNPEAGHYFERSWLAIFHPIPDTCQYFQNL